MGMEIRNLDDYTSFHDVGTDEKAVRGYKRMKYHFVFNVKHDGRHKARFVAGGHLTPAVPLDEVYSSIVSLRGIRLVAFAAELNELGLWGTDITSAYLEQSLPLWTRLHLD